MQQAVRSIVFRIINSTYLFNPMKQLIYQSINQSNQVHQVELIHLIKEAAINPINLIKQAAFRLIEQAAVQSIHQSITRSIVQ